MTFPSLRLAAAIPAIASIALLSPACAQAPAVRPNGAHADHTHAAHPSKLDYLVFASLADSSRLPALTAGLEPVRVGQPRD